MSVTIYVITFNYGRMEHTNDSSRLAGLREKTKALRFVVLGGSMVLDSFNVEGLAFDQISIATHFGITPSVASWSLSAYSLTYGCFLLLSGSAGTYPNRSVPRPCTYHYAKCLGDVFGHRLIYIAGLVGFSIFAALTAGIDSSAIALFVLRALQGICAAATIPTAYALVANLYDGKGRELAVAGLGACQAFGAAVGTIRKFVIWGIPLNVLLTSSSWWRIC
jgi:MFS family permease